MERLSAEQAENLCDLIEETVPDHLKLGKAVLAIEIFSLEDDPEAYRLCFVLRNTLQENEIRSYIPLEQQDNVVVRAVAGPQRHQSTLSEKDQEALRRNVRDLSDIPPERLEQIDEGFARAYQVAEDIRTGRRDPLR